MESDLEGRVKNTSVPLTQGIDTIFEAVVNSIQAMPIPKEGKIKITVLSSTTKTIDGTKGNVIVHGFIIKDDGVGFNNSNYTSFRRLDTQHKSHLGCKGIGRLSWLKVFQHISIESIFEENGRRFKRCFTFSINDGVSGGDTVEETKEPISTTVTLDGCTPDYQKNMPVTAKTISERIFNHCISFFISGNAPSIKVQQDDQEHYVEDYLEEQMHNTSSESFVCSGYEFELKHVRFYSGTNGKSGLSFCANGLEVLPTNDFNVVPMDEHGNVFRYRCYVSSKLLDDTVNNSRNNFDLGSEERTIEEHDLPSLSEIKKQVVERCEKYLVPYSDYYLDKCKARMKEFNDSEYGKPFSAAVKYDSDLIKNIRPDMTPEEMYDKYSQSQAKVESSVIFRPATRKKSKIDNSDAIESEFEKVNQIQKDQLTRMIIHRSIVIATYRNRLDAINDECGEDKKRFIYEQEKLIHDILLPRGTDKRNRPTYESCNLWMLDERLNQYVFMNVAYSEKKIGDSKDERINLRPDIVIFGDITEDECAKSVAIIELKRPQRKDTSIIDQLIKYVEEIDCGTAIDYCGQPIKTSPGMTTYYCYAVCDVNSPEFKTLMKRWSMKPQFGGSSYFRWHDEYNASITAIDHVKIVSDAKTRNKIFFEMISVNIDKDDIIVKKMGKEANKIELKNCEN